MKAEGRTFWRLYYHVVWRTKNSEPLLVGKVKEHLLHYLHLKCAELGCKLEAANAVDDHVHLLMSIPPKWSVAEIVQRLKGSSAHHLNHELDLEPNIYWQRGYGVVSVSPRHVPSVRKYVESQEERHREGNLIAALEKTEEEEA